VISFIVFACTKPRIISSERQNAKEQPGLDPRLTPSRVAQNVLLIQPLSFQSLPHSFSRWTRANSFPFNLFHTLSILMGGGGILRPKTSTVTLSIPRTTKYSGALFFQPLTNCPFSIPFVLTFIHLMGGVPSLPGYSGPDVRTCRRFDVQTPFASPASPIAAQPPWCHNGHRRNISSPSGETTPLAPVSKDSERTSGTA
jgi:hypothetical protein